MTLAMQARCVWCMKEQYGPSIAAFSGGYARCGCGRSTVAMSDAQWRSILRVRMRDTKVTESVYTCVDCAPTPHFDLAGLLAHLRGTHFPFVQTDDPEDDEW